MYTRKQYAQHRVVLAKVVAPDRHAVSLARGDTKMENRHTVQVAGKFTCFKVHIMPSIV